MRKVLVLTLFTAALLAACSSKDTGFTYSDLPAGDATHGEALFAESVNGSVACSNCHTVTGADGAGPTLEGFASTAASRVKGQSAQEYAFYSILRPSKYLVSGFSNVMPTNYEEALSKQDTADLIAYLTSLGGSGAASTGAVSGGGDKSVDTYMLIFRLIHIFAGAFWFGAGVFMIAFIEPTLKSTGASGQPFMRAFIKTTKFGVAMPVSAILTTIAGVALFYRVSDHFNADWMGSTAGIVLSIGATAGLLAFLHGATMIGPNTSRMSRLMDELDQLQGPPSDELLGRMRKLQRESLLHGRISALLIVVAMGCMISAKYL